jgi:hypothetical protein
VFSGEYFWFQARYSCVNLGGQAATSGFAGVLGKLPGFTWRFSHLHLKILHSTSTTTTSYCGIDAHGSQFCGFCYQGRGTGPLDWPKVIPERHRSQPVKTGQEQEEHAEIQGLTAEIAGRMIRRFHSCRTRQGALRLQPLQVSGHGFPQAAENAGTAVKEGGFSRP